MSIEATSTEPKTGNAKVASVFSHWILDFLVHRPDSGTLREQIGNRQTDMSESAWFFLVFLIVLVIEQALAVHLSFHLRGNEALPPAQAVRPQATAA